MNLKVKKFLRVGLLALALALGGMTVSEIQFDNTAGCWASGSTGEIFCD